MPSSSEIRQQFIDFFTEKHGHAFVPSSPVVPHDDPTLLFTNAGMNQFKPIFLGEAPLDTYGPPRAANSQKCIRAGGKHNDLDDVGRDTYHHTFFEMLGNWSFGDYFKAEAIAWAWELLTGVWGLDPERLHATYFEGDPSEGLEPDLEAKDLWAKYLPAERIHPGNKKDNFWEMGDVGPCGPCSEIHYDRSEGKDQGAMVNADGQDTVVEIWNLVFIQFNRTQSGLKPLPAKHVDTGMGFERICRVLQNAASNYETDVFMPLIDKIAEISGKSYNADLKDPIGIAFRAIADHARMATFSIVDGAIPDNKGRGSVLRSVIRRAGRYGYSALGQREPFMHQLVSVVVASMGQAFPEIIEKQSDVERIVRQEEADFLKVIDRGLKLYAQAADEARANNNVLSGEVIFDLLQTHGFPEDMTFQLARDEGLTPDVLGFEEARRRHEIVSGGGRSSAMVIDFGDLPDTDDAAKYDCVNDNATVLAFVRGDAVAIEGNLNEGDTASVLLDRTCFYAEQGGQVGDTGTLRSGNAEFSVEDTRRVGDRVLHVGKVTGGTLSVGDTVECRVNNRRSRIMANHSATHLLNLALKQTLGDHVQQKGSLVDDQKTRFDFSHDSALSHEDIVKVERRVNALVQENLEVRSKLMPLAEAKELPGVRAVFGEKYPDPVRVIYVTPGDLEEGNGEQNSIEFCGGTHTKRTGDIGFFKIVSEESVSKGVRRVTAVTGLDALTAVQQTEQQLKGIGQALSVPADQAAERVAGLQKDLKSLKKKLDSGGGSGGGSLSADALLGSAESLGEAKLVIAEAPGATDAALRNTIDAIKTKAGSVAVLLAATDEDKLLFVAGVSDDLIKKGLKAGDWVREVSKVTGGGGGGRPNLAQAGGKDVSKLGDALAIAKDVATAAIG